MRVTLKPAVCVVILAASSGSAWAANGFLNGKPFEALNNQIETNAENIADLQAQTEQLTNDVAAINTTITTLETSVAQNRVAIDAIVADIDTLEADLGATQADVDMLFADLSNLRLQHIRDLEAVLAAIEEARVSIEGLRAQVYQAVAELGGAIADLDAAVAANASNVSLLLAQTAGMMADILAMNAILDGHESRLAALEGAVGPMLSRLDALENDLADLATEIAGVDTRVATLEGYHTTSFTGVRTNVPSSSLNGWEECYAAPYGQNGPSVSAALSNCTKSKIMLACRVTGAPVLTVAAYANREDVLFDTGTSNVTHAANGVQWYFSDNWSFGFAPIGVNVDRHSCDTGSGQEEQRLCFHTSVGSMTGGWSCGAAQWLNGSNAYEKVILHAD